MYLASACVCACGLQTSYQEQKIQDVKVSYNLVFYDCCPNEPWPTLTYTIQLKRESFFYLNFTLLPSVILSLISFAVFYMTFEVGERLGFGITMVLIVEVSKQTIQALVPICGELLWMELFFWVNFFATTFSLCESCLVLGIAYNRVEHFVSSCYP